MPELTEAQLEQRRADNQKASDEAEKRADEARKADLARGIQPGVAGSVQALAQAVKNKLEGGDIKQSLDTHVTRNTANSEGVPLPKRDETAQ